MSDWKKFYRENKWAPSRLLVEKFGIKKHDIDNWIRKPEVRLILNRRKWKPSKGQSPEDTSDTLQAAWKYYILEERGWSLENEDIVKKLLGLRTPPSPFSFLTESKYLSKLEGYEKWRRQGFTRVAYAIYNIYPGKKFCDERHIIPELFFQTHTKNSTRQDIVRVAEHIYLWFFQKLHTDRPEVVNGAKEEFIAMHKENNFLNQRFLQEYGISANHFAKHSYVSVIEELAFNFRRDLGLLDAQETLNWNKDKYIRQNPERDFAKCNYCTVTTVDLHHLLSRKERPDLAFNKENVVPLCTAAHTEITRNRLSDGMKILYKTAEVDWICAPSGEKIAAFDDVMQKIHEVVYGDMYVRDNLN